ncbi:MAG: CvpA family protein [Candidatus Omnitrophica bacterium]|nr:CvpA family protein [Candidatus Omnitrophota bacterium]
MVDYIQSLNWVDFVILFGIIRGAYVGYQDGVVKEILRIFLYLVTLVVLHGFSGVSSEYIYRNTFLGPEVSTALAISAMALITYLVLKIIADMVLKIAGLENNTMFKIIGLFVGMARWAGILSVVFMLITRANVPGLESDIQNGSRWGGWVVPIAPNIVNFISEMVPQLGLLLG